MTTETNPIDEKKNDPSSKIDIKGFFKNYASSIIFSIGLNVFILGTIGLYTTKVAQANILPDNPELAPYTMFDRIIINDIPIDINIMRPKFNSENKEILSQKAIFESQKYLDSFSNSFLCSLKDSANPKHLFSNIPLYFFSVYSNLIATIFSIINAFFFKMSYINESIFMLVYGLVYSIIWFVIFYYALFWSIFYHIANIPQLFRNVEEIPNIDDSNPNLNPLKKPRWESEEKISIFRFGKFISFLVYLIIIIPSIFVSAFAFTIYGFFAPLYATYKIQDDKTNKSEGIFDFIKNTFKYKKLFFFILASTSLVSNGISNFGTAYAISFLLAIVAAWFLGLYVNIMPEEGINGFTFGIRNTPIQSVIKEKSEEYMVEMCGVIPMVDETMNQILKNAKKNNNIRKIKVGGNKKVTFDDNIKIRSIETKMNTTEPIKTEPINYEPINSEPIKTEPINSEPINSEPFEPMTGGKKIKQNYKKKYNIKFT